MLLVMRRVETYTYSTVLYIHISYSPRSGGEDGGREPGLHKHGVVVVVVAVVAVVVIVIVIVIRF